ncbi:hypothetical protein Sjap_001378 [Stephania japonica]|uniref:Uncharacterized protein n=1 Tax=Stephania japonica TaxID=461633 RepID=A0AAP0KJT9_9MAGN
MNLLCLSKSTNPCTRFQHKRESKAIWAHISALHLIKQNQSFSKEIILRVPFKHGVPKEHIWLRHLIKHLAGVEEIVGISEGRDEFWGYELVVLEAMSDYLVLGLLDLV